MAKKQTSFADKAAKHRGKGGEAVYAKYIKSVRSEKTGQWRFNEKMIRMDKVKHWTRPLNEWMKPLTL